MKDIAFCVTYLPHYGTVTALLSKYCTYIIYSKSGHLDVKTAPLSGFGTSRPQRIVLKSEDTIAKTNRRNSKTNLHHVKFSSMSLLL